MSAEALYIGKRHYDMGGNPLGGIKVKIDDAKVVEVEGGEYKICAQAYGSDEILSYTQKTNKEILDDIHQNFVCKFKQSKADSGDFIICRLVVNDVAKHNRKGTVRQILDAMQDDKSCRTSYGDASMAKGGEISEAELSKRWDKKKEHLGILASNIRSLRYNISTDMKSDDEKDFLTALVLSIMDKTAERVGNEESQKNGRHGVTGFKKKHVKIAGNTIYLDYVGKSGVKHEKSFSDSDIADALKRAIKNSPNQFVFTTSDGFRIKNDRVNRYLSEYGISAKDIRGFTANKWIADKLNALSVVEENQKKRKRQFNKLLKAVAKKVGHGAATLRKHYLMPELEFEFVERGKIINLSDYYGAGGKLSRRERIKANRVKIKKIMEQGGEVKSMTLGEEVADMLSSWFMFK